MSRSKKTATAVNVLIHFLTIRASDLVQRTVIMSSVAKENNWEQLESNVWIPNRMFRSTSAPYSYQLNF